MPRRIKKSKEYATLFNNLIDLCDKHDTSVTTLLDKFVSSKSAMQAWKNGNINTSVIPKLAQHFDVSLDYLFTGKESQLSELPKDEKELLTHFKDLPHDQQQRLIGMAILLQEQVKEQENDEKPNLVYLYYDQDLRVSAGLGEELQDYQQWEKVPVIETPQSRKADFILTVDGYSMEPRFYEDDLVLVRIQPDIDDGQIGIFRLNGEGYIKKKQGNRLVSLNPKYPDLIINSEDYQCFGLVLGTAEIVEKV